MNGAVSCTVLPKIAPVRVVHHFRALARVPLLVRESTRVDSIVVIQVVVVGHPQSPVDTEAWRSKGAHQ